MQLTASASKLCSPQMPLSLLVQLVLRHTLLVLSLCELLCPLGTAPLGPPLATPPLAMTTTPGLKSSGAFLLSHATAATLSLPLSLPAA
jgi:hypothetical protein